MGIDTHDLPKIFEHHLFKEAEGLYPDLKDIFQKSDQDLSYTKYSQPALYVFSCIMFEVFASNNFKNHDKNSTHESLNTNSVNVANDVKNVHNISIPSYIAGHSVGEYAACFAAGVFSFLDGLRLVKLRSELMADCPGTMFACIGAYENVLKFVDYVKENTDFTCEIANYNHESQIVISCNVEAADFISKEAKNFKIKCIKLQVSGGFHSSLVQSAKDELAVAIENTHFNDPVYTLISNKTGIAETKAVNVKSNLIDHVVSQVKWKDTMDLMKNDEIAKIIEFSPKNVLSKLAEKSGLMAVTLNSINDIMKFEF